MALINRIALGTMTSNQMIRVCSAIDNGILELMIHFE